MNYSNSELGKIGQVRAKAKDDFYFYCKHILGYEDMRPQPHAELCEFMNRWDKRKKLVLLPRGTFKSTVATVSYSLYRLCYDPNLRIMIATENYPNAQLYMREIKDHIEKNETMRLVYGNMKPHSTRGGDWTKTEITVATRTKVGGKEPSIQASSLGTTKVGLHYDLLILDDLVSNNNINTHEQMQKVIDYYKYLLSIADPGAQIIIIGTRYHFGDLYAYIQDHEMENFDFLIRGAYNPDGSLYFPERLTEEFLEEQKKSQGSWIFSCQYLNQAVDKENQVFKEEWINYYNTPPQALNYFITIDPAGTTNRKSDYTAILVIGIDCDSNIWVLENHQLKVSQSDWMDLVFRKAKQYGIGLDGGGVVSLETNALQKTYKYAFDLEMEKRGYYLPIKESAPHGSSGNKESRIAALQPFFEQGRVYLKKDMYSLIDQILRYPKSKNDDQIDALKDILPIMYPAEMEKQKTKVELNKKLTENEKKEWETLEHYYSPPRKVKRTKYRRV